MNPSKEPKKINGLIGHFQVVNRKFSSPLYVKGAKYKNTKKHKESYKKLVKILSEIKIPDSAIPAEYKDVIIRDLMI